MEFGEFPAEVKANPVEQLIVLMNVDLKNNPDHKLIWDSFSANRRSDRLPLQFRVADSTHVFPKPKPKKFPADGGSPSNVAQSTSSKYILKSNWFYKHANALPAVVVLVFDLDWDHPSLNEKKLECATKIETLRHSLEGRNTRICVVLVQKSPPLPADSIFAQRAQELCTQCSLPLKALFVLPLSDHLCGYILRLEHAFFELADNYYQHQIKCVKQSRDLVARFNTLTLLTRYQIKLGYYNELRQDPHSALRHYKQAYQHILEIKLDSFNSLDVKITAGLLNFKISQICFAKGTPIDAIGHFRKHVDYFKDKSSSGLEFEHFGWMSKQFGLFADLFDRAVQNGLAAVQTLHPGFYYQSAGEYATARGDAAVLAKRRHGDELAAVGDGGPLDADSRLRHTIDRARERLANFRPTFFGQRPWHALLSDYPHVDLTLVQTQADNNLVLDEKSAFLYYQYKEYTAVDHSSIILEYLSSASIQYKRYRCPRMRLLIMVRTGEQYMVKGEFEKALQILSPVVWEYRSERWFTLLTYASKLALKCAYMACNLKAYVCLALELCSHNLHIPDEGKRAVQENFLRILGGRAPQPVLVDDDDDNVQWEPGAAQETVLKKWQETLDHGCFFQVMMHNIYSFVEIRLNFEHREIKADEIVHLFVRIRLSCPLPVRFSKLSISFENQLYDQFCSLVVDNPANDDRLYLRPAQVYTFPFKFSPTADDVDKDLTIKCMTLELGHSGSQAYGSLLWERFDYCSPYPILDSFRATLPKSFENLPCTTSVRILPRDANLSIDFHHTPPILTGEIYPIVMTVKNLEQSRIFAINIDAVLTTTDPSAGFVVEHSTTVTGALNLNVEFIDPLSSHVASFAIQCGGAASPLHFSCTLSYSMQVSTEFGPVVCRCRDTKTLDFSVLSPFSLLDTHICNFRNEPLEKLVVKEKCILFCEVKCMSHFPVKIQSVRWKLSDHLTDEGDLSDDMPDLETSLCSGSSVSFVNCILPEKWSCSPLALGQLLIRWNRLDNPSAQQNSVVETCIDLPCYAVELCPVMVTARVPAYSSVRSTFLTRYSILNLTENILDLSLTMDSSDFFMFSGEKQISNLRLLPFSDVQLSYVYLPLTAGLIGLPRLKLISQAYAQEILDNYAQRNVPTSIFVLPCNKKSADSMDFGVVEKLL